MFLIVEAVWIASHHFKCGCSITINCKPIEILEASTLPGNECIFLPAHDFDWFHGSISDTMPTTKDVHCILHNEVS